MGLSASQGRMLLLTARRSDLEFRAQQISQKRLILSQQLEEISQDYEDATSNRIMNIGLYYVDEDGKKVNKTSNLTYAALMSATYSLGSQNSGIKTPSGYQSQEYESVKPYRLVNADGAIVVSDESEIMTDIATGDREYKESKPSSEYRFNNKNISNLYEEKEIEEDSVLGTSTTVDSQLKYHKNGEDSLFSDEKYNDATFLFDPASGVMQVTIPGAGGESDTVEYYDMTKGKDKAKLEDDDSKIEDFDDADPDTLKSVELVTTGENQDIGDVVKNEYYEIEYQQIGIGDSGSGYSLTKGPDGTYTLQTDDFIRKYVVDPGLADDSTIVSGSITGPNYLQDCLRNGKYMLQQGTGQKDENGNYKWSSVSWDATSNISDSYYTEDDDAAKAKYDRLQTQIQNQDKKLELELDNIETQRQAVTTEIESIQKVIDENIEGTFNTFNA